MTHDGDYGQPGQDPQQQGSGQQWPQEQWPPQYQQPGPGQQGRQDGPWHRQSYDPGAHQQRLGGQQYPPEGQPWTQAQPPYPPQGQQWPQPGNGPPPGYNQPPFPSPQPGFQPPPRRKPWAARHKVLTGLMAFAALVVIAVAANAAGSSSSSSTATTASTGSAATQAAAPASHPASAATHASAAPVAQTVTYIITGSPADVTYGPSGSDYSGSVPMRVTRRLGSPDYYAIDAQLQGGGTVSCQILVDGKVISRATASGDYNIASCEISQNPFSGNWEDTNQGA